MGEATTKDGAERRKDNHEIQQLREKRITGQ
jgi:hypothetical protein